MDLNLSSNEGLSNKNIEMTVKNLVLQHHCLDSKRILNDSLIQ